MANGILPLADVTSDYLTYLSLMQNGDVLFAISNLLIMFLQTIQFYMKMYKYFGLAFARFIVYGIDTIQFFIYNVYYILKNILAWPLQYSYLVVAPTKHIIVPSPAHILP